jgi:hypothetical protein
MTEIMLWRRLDLPGHEIARLEALDDGWKLFGTAIFAYQRAPSKLGINGEGWHGLVSKRA